MYRTSPTNIKRIEFDVRKFFRHFDGPVKMASTIEPHNQDTTNHVPFACSGTEIKNFDLALWRALSQQVPDGSDYVTTQKLSKQIVLDIHSLYASRWIDGDVIDRNRV